MERGCAAEYSGEKDAMDRKEEKKGKEDKGQRKGKKHKAKDHGTDGGRSIQSANMNHSIAMEQAEVSAKMAENPRLEQAEDIMSKSEVKKDRKKKKRDKEVDTISQKQAEVSAKMAEKPSLEHAEDMMSKSHVKEGRKKRKRDKEVDTISQKQAEVSAKMAEKPSLEHAEDIMSKSNVKEDRKKKKRDKEVDTSSQKHAEVSAEMAEKPSLQHTERIMSKSEAKKDRKKKKKDKEADTVSQKQVLDANDESIGSEYVQRNKGEGEHDIKSKKGKRKHWDGETSSNGSSGDQIVSVRDNKRRRKESSITLEESNEVDISKMGQKTVGKKKRRNEIDKFGVDLCQNSPAGDDKNCNKEKETRKDDNNGGKSKKVNIAHRKDESKRVSFTDDVEVFNISGGDDSGDDGLVHGRRFTPDEDAQLMEAIEKYAEMKQLGEKGLEMIRESIKHPEVRGCWAEIATSLPHRPVMAIYKRARILLYRSVERKWTQEEYEIVRRFVEKNGTNWKKLATELGKSEIHVKDTWRRMKPKNLKKGAWSQDEYQNLFDLVNMDLRVKAHQKIAPSHRQLKDNISWEAISEKLSTRSNKDCCLKWYQQLASPLVKEGIWADTDDYLLIEALQKIDAVCVEDVDWEGLVDHRSGELCRQRWNQMVRMIGGHREKPFIEQVEVLARRYCPEMLDYRKPELSDLSPDELAGGSDT